MQVYTQRTPMVKLSVKTNIKIFYLPWVFILCIYAHMISVVWFRKVWWKYYLFGISESNLWNSVSLMNSSVPNFVSMKEQCGFLWQTIIFWVLMRRSIVSGHQHFRGTYCCHVLNLNAHSHENLRTCNYVITIITLKCVLFNFMVIQNSNSKVSKSKAQFINHFTVWVK
jgi:hypothetical protein